MDLLCFNQNSTITCYNSRIFKTLKTQIKTLWKKYFIVLQIQLTEKKIFMLIPETKAQGHFGLKYGPHSLKTLSLQNRYANSKVL